MRVCMYVSLIAAPSGHWSLSATDEHCRVVRDSIAFGHHACGIHGRLSGADRDRNGAGVSFGQDNRLNRGQGERARTWPSNPKKPSAGFPGAIGSRFRAAFFAKASVTGYSHRICAGP
jgi:hypothetical protein